MTSQEHKTQSFIDKARAIHGDKYDYSKSVYIKNNVKVIIICPKHGQFRQVPASHISQKCGCPECANQSRGKAHEKMAAKNRSLVEAFPSLIDEWDYAKNEGLNPQDFSYGSGRKVWWLCDKGHSYETRVCNRTRKEGASGCPVCRGAKVSTDNNLLVKFPLIAAQWHKTKNGTKLPEEYRPKSHAKVWWRCDRYEEHEWEAAISNRTNLGSGCPKCGVSTSLPELRIYAEFLSLFSDTQHRYKEGKQEIDVFIPSLQIGIEYDGAYYHANKLERDKRKTEELSRNGIDLIRVRVAPLKKLSSHDVVVKEGELSKESLNDLVTSILTFDHEEAASDRLKNYIDHPDFNDEKSYQKFVDYLPNPFPENSCSALPELAALWDFEANHPLKPENFAKGSGKEIWWQCESHPEHTWKQAINVQTQMTGCPYCATSNRRLTDEISFARLSPKAAARWHKTKNGDSQPSDFHNRSNKKAWFQCDQVDYHVYEQTIAGAAIGSGCPYCEHNDVHPNDSLATLHPEIASEWSDKNAPLTADQVAVQSQKKRWWVCSKNPNHEWEAVVASRTAQGTGCPYCSGRLASSDNNLEALYPEVAAEFNSVKNEKPANAYKPGSGKKVWWKCSTNPQHEWEAVIGSRTKLGTGCPHCFNERRGKTRVG
jgi:hypothetical protein